jgi:hypothetical protein
MWHYEVVVIAIMEFVVFERSLVPKIFFVRHQLVVFAILVVHFDPLAETHGRN